MFFNMTITLTLFMEKDRLCKYKIYEIKTELQTKAKKDSICTVFRCE